MRLSFLGELILAFAIAIPMRASGAPVSIRFSHVVSENTPKGIGALLFKKLAEERTDGQVQVTVFPNSSVASDDEVFDPLIHDEVQLAAPSFGKFTPSWLREKGSNDRLSNTAACSTAKLQSGIDQ
jgi:C4-dicarboxylate-binding protein DctP